MMTNSLPDIVPLNPKMRQFAVEYSKDFNGPDAMLRAGYQGTVGWKAMLTDNRVEAVVREELNRRGLRSRIDPDEVIRELEAMAFSSPADYITMVDHPDKSGRKLPSLMPIDEMSTAAAKSIKEIEITSGGGIKLKVHDKKAALELLGRHLGLFNADQSNNRDVVVSVRQFKEGEEDEPSN